MAQMSATGKTTHFLMNSSVAVSQNDFEEQVVLRSNIIRVLPSRPPSNFEQIPPRFAYPPDSNADQSSDGSSSFLAILIPVLSILFIICLTTTACFVRKFYKRHPKGLKSNCDIGSESGFEEQEPLSKADKIQNQHPDMRIIQEPKKNTDAKEGGPDKEKLYTPGCHASLPDQTPGVTLSEVQIENPENESKEGLIHEKTHEVQPDNSNLLAAAAAFQAFTVPALKRLPYTPDPDYTPCEVHDTLVESNEPTDAESEDKVTPLVSATPKTKRMKPRGLLERRGSNVALTITLRAGEKSNVPATITSAKSPRPLAYLQKASSPLSPNELHVKSCDASCLQREFWEIPMNHPSENHFNVAGYGTKNRYRTILPNEHSRVKLPKTSEEEPLSSYINANYIRDCTDLHSPSSSSTDEELTSPSVCHKNAAFIATQGPMANTLVDFWRMVWEENAASVIMITKLKERKEKCTQYLPVEVGDVTTYQDMRVKVAAVKKYDHFAVRSLEVTRQNQTRTIRHYWYTTWMDHETPEKTRGLLELVQEVSLWKKPSHGPMVVHCSAGIGRTGCYIAVTVGCQQLMKIGRTDILRLVSQMRLDRGGMVQTWEQYQFIHQALSRYGRILAGENVTTPSTTGSIRSPCGMNGRHPGPKEALTIEIPRPQTPKQRRSLSEAHLPSPKETKLNLKYSPSQQVARNNNTSKLQSLENRSSKQQQMNIMLPNLEALPSSPSQRSRSENSPEPTKSSPALQSPFGRLCLQNKDMNIAASSPTSNGHFELPGNGACLNGGIQENDPKSGAETVSKKAFNFNFSFSNPSSPETTSVETKTLLKNGSENGRLAFKIPDNKGSAQLSNRDTNSLPTKGRVTPKSGGTAKSTTPETAANLSHFVFPLPDRR